MLNELKVVQNIWQSGERPSNEQLAALLTALVEKISREPLEGLEHDIWKAIAVSPQFEDEGVWEMIERVLTKELYLNEKKSRYFLNFQAGDHHFEGNFFYWLTFKNEITRREFHRIMSEAEEKNDRFASLNDEEFQKKHGIVSFEEFHPDFNGYLEPQYVTVDKDGNIIEEDWSDEDVE